MKLTQNSIKRLKPKETRFTLWDDQIAGFGVRVQTSGRKSYVLKYREGGGGRSARQRWYTIGSCDAMSLHKAREDARRLLGEVASGSSPQAQKMQLRRQSSLKEVWERFVERDFVALKPNTQAEYKAMWKNYLLDEFGRRRAKEITKSDIEAFLQTLQDKPYRANRLLALLSRLMNLSESWGVRELNSNPCRHVKKYKEKSRERYLSKGELTTLFKVLDEMVSAHQVTQGVANALRLLVLTGARRNEIVNCETAWVDLKSSQINLPDSKTGSKKIYLNKEALPIIQRQIKLSLGSKYLFPSPVKDVPITNISKVWRKVRTAAGLSDVRIHDLRHTAASILVNDGVPLPIIGKFLGHKQSRTTERYSHIMDDPVRRAAQSISIKSKK